MPSPATLPERVCRDLLLAPKIGASAVQLAAALVSGDEAARLVDVEPAEFDRDVRARLTALAVQGGPDVFWRPEVEAFARARRWVGGS